MQMPDSILVVEDNKTQQRLMKILAERVGVYAHVVSNGAEALAALSADTYGLVLMDWQMPGMDGLQCTEKIREMDATTGRHTPIIAVTAQDEGKERCLESGMDGFLAKPFSVEEFKALIERWIAK